VTAAQRPKVLCVDDEQMLLDGVALNLRRHFEVFTATSGAAGISIMAREPDLAVVMSDMRMP